MTRVALTACSRNTAINSPRLRGEGTVRCLTSRFAVLAALTVLFSSTAFSATIEVKSGESIQAAIDAASPGDEIRVAPESFTEAITIRTENLALVSATANGERAVLDGQGAQLELIRVEANGVRVEGFAVHNAMASGIVVYNARDVLLADLVVEDNAFIGINVADSEGITLDRCSTSGHASAGILVAQSSQIRISGSTTFDNLTGVRIENSDNFAIENNSLFRNTTGIALLTLPDRARPRTEYGRVFYNRILDNNRPTTADPGTIDAAMLSGIGLLVIASDHVEAGRNRFERNETYAAVTLSLPSAPLPDNDSTTVDPNSDHFYIHHNRFADNGSEASAEFEAAFPNQPSGDFYWDGKGERNQWQESGEFRTVPEDLVQQQGGAHTNVIHFV